jgi:hypothetical protein
MEWPWLNGLHSCFVFRRPTFRIFAHRLAIQCNDYFLVLYFQFICNRPIICCYTTYADKAYIKNQKSKSKKMMNVWQPATVIILHDLYCSGIRDFKSPGTTWLIFRSVLLRRNSITVKKCNAQPVGCCICTVISARNSHLRLTINRNMHYSYHIICYCSFDLVDFFVC